MTTIKTHLRTRATDHNGNLTLNSADRPKAFNGVYNLGLILGSQDDKTRRLPVDNDNLIQVKNGLNHVIETCLLGLQGIGGLIVLAEPTDKLTNHELCGVGLAIQQLARLAQESQDHIETVEMDITRRNKAKETRHD